MHPNAQAVLAGFKAFAEGDMVTMKELFADDVTWHVGGRNKWSGDYHGADAILRFFGDISAESTITQDLHAVLADDEHVVVLVNSTVAKDGETLDNPTTFIFHAADGKISEAWGVSMDQQKADEFWA